MGFCTPLIIFTILFVAMTIAGRQCPNYCPMNCGSMILCPMINDQSGCPMPPVCVSDFTMCPK